MTTHSSRTHAPRVSRPRWQRRKEARPAEIVAAALEAFVERGYTATKLEDVARRAGITKGTMYLYFANKEELFKAVVRESIVPVIALGERMAQEHRGASRDLLADLIRGWWEHIGSSKISGIPKLMMAEAGNFPELARFYFDEVVQRGQRLITGVLQQGVERGEFRPLDLAVAAKLAFAPLVHFAVMKHSFGHCVAIPLDPHVVIEAHIDVFTRGISRDPAERGHA
jgi:AcrR family transcriptional regulator